MKIPQSARCTGPQLVPSIRCSTMPSVAQPGDPNMLKLSAFADEISTQLDEQIKVAKDNAVTHFELRGVYEKNVLDWDKPLRSEVKTKLAANGISAASIGSPIGKVKITDDWAKHFDRFKVAVELAEF